MVDAETQNEPNNELSDSTFICKIETSRSGYGALNKENIFMNPVVED